MTYKAAVVKRYLELAGMFPFVLLGRLAGKIFKLKTKHSVFLFYPCGEIGGSIQVNADIANCIKDVKPLIIFSKKPKNNLFRDRFNIEGVRVIDLHKYIDNKLFHFVNFFFRGVIASWVNEAKDPVILGGECMFFYKIVPHVKESTWRVDLCHYSTWFNYSQEFVKYIDCRIFSTPQIKRDAEKHYRENKVPQQYFERLFFIDNMIPIPPLVPVHNPVLEVVFVGRGSPQKRPHLAAAVAKEMHERKADVHFSFVGNLEGIIPDDIKQYCTVYGSIGQREKLNEVYQQSDVLMLTSLYEGLPIVVMEMMARGKIVVSTAIDGIPDYIKHMENGLLITETEEDKIVMQSADHIQLLIDDAALRARFQQKSYREAIAHFDKDQFCNAYRDLLIRKRKPAHLS